VTSVPITIDGTWLITFLLVMTRIAAFLVIAPPFNGRSVPSTVKAMLAAGLALPLTPQAIADVPAATTTALTLAIITQVLIGAAFGLATLALFSAIQSAGAIIDLTGGFALSMAFDPMSAQQQSLFARFHQLIAGVLLLVSGAYMIVLKGLSRSFDAFPLDAAAPARETALVFSELLTHSFVAAVQIAAPMVAVMFLADVGLGLMSKAAPALNAFSLGFPLKILLVLLLLALTFPLLPGIVHDLANRAASLMSGGGGDG
jgi:flagellar biosynthesis protein FliR